MTIEKIKLLKELKGTVSMEYIKTLNVGQLEFLLRIKSEMPLFNFDEFRFNGDHGPYFFLMNNKPTFSKSYFRELLEDRGDNISLDEFLNYYRLNSSLFGLVVNDENDVYFQFKEINFKEYKTLALDDIINDNILKDLLLEKLSKLDSIHAILTPINFDIKGFLYNKATNDIIIADLLCVKKIHKLDKFMTYTVIEHNDNNNVTALHLKGISNKQQEQFEGMMNAIINGEDKISTEEITFSEIKDKL